MLFLQPAVEASAPDIARRLPLDDAAALHLEQALLAADQVTRLTAVEQALAADQNLANWTFAAAEVRLGRTVNHRTEAANWLAVNLVAELRPVLRAENAESQSTGIEWRLPALVEKLFDCEQRLADFEHRVEHEKLEAMKELAYGASHEINNPLANIAARAQTLLDGEQDPSRRQKLTAIHRQAMRAHEMISDLMLFARPPKLKMAVVNLRELVRRVREGLSSMAAERSIRLEMPNGEFAPEIFGDATQIGVALDAVVRNAIEATDEGGSVSISIRPSDVAGGPWAEIVIADDGPGITAEVRRHMFDPFFSGREAGRGLGFGLSKCWRIVTDHGGQVVACSPASGGAEISLLLPLSIPAAVAHPNVSARC